MATYKYTMLFELRTNLTGTAQGAHIGGWSESVYDNALFPTSFVDLQLARAAILPSGARIVGQRIQQVFPAGAAAATGQVFPGAFLIDSDVPQMALLCTARALGAGNARRFTLRGIPDDMVFQGEYRPQGSFDQLVKAYFAKLEASSWKFPGRDLLARPKVIDSIDATGAVVMADEVTLDPGDKIRIRGTETDEEFEVSGIFRVKSWQDTSHFKIVNWKAGATSGGTLINTTPKLLFAFSQTSINRVALRKVGRGFGQYRGRSSKRQS